MYNKLNPKYKCISLYIPIQFIQYVFDRVVFSIFNIWEDVANPHRYPFLLQLNKARILLDLLIASWYIFDTNWMLLWRWRGWYTKKSPTQKINGVSYMLYKCEHKKVHTTYSVQSLLKLWAKNNDIK